MKIDVSQVIDRPPEVVFQFVGFEHILNHPRWDTKMEVEQLSDGPLGVGTIIRRRQTRAGYPDRRDDGVCGIRPTDSDRIRDPRGAR